MLLWIGFGAVVSLLLWADLAWKKEQEVTTKESLIWSAVWIGVSLSFNIVLYFLLGGVKAMEFLGGYLLEKSLSMDNLFMFIVIFGYFRIPPRHQKRVLLWGILGALIMRAIFIGVGVVLVKEFEWTLGVFGVLLIATCCKMLMAGDEAPDPSENRLVKLVNRFIPIYKEDHGGKFFVKISHDGGRERWAMTWMFVALLVVESTDLLFAVDSIPAVFGVTSDPFIVYTSNIFAILGLRSLYFAVRGMAENKSLKYGIIVVLGFIGAKMIGATWLGWHMTPWMSITIVIGILTGSWLLSLFFGGRKGSESK